MKELRETIEARAWNEDRHQHRAALLDLRPGATDGAVGSSGASLHRYPQWKVDRMPRAKVRSFPWAMLPAEFSPAGWASIALTGIFNCSPRAASTIGPRAASKLAMFSTVFRCLDRKAIAPRSSATVL